MVLFGLFNCSKLWCEKDYSLLLPPLGKGFQTPARGHISHGLRLWFQILCCIWLTKAWILLLCWSDGGFSPLKTFPAVFWSAESDYDARKPSQKSVSASNPIPSGKMSEGTAGCLQVAKFGPLQRKFGHSCHTHFQNKAYRWARAFFSNAAEITGHSFSSKYNPCVCVFCCIMLLAVPNQW